MAANWNAKSLLLMVYTQFEMNFEHEEAPPGEIGNELGTLDKLNEGNEGASSEGSVSLKLKSTDHLISQAEGNTDFDITLRSMLKKTLGNRLEASSGSTSFAWKMKLVTETRASLKCFVGGGFFEGFLAECKVPVKLKLELIFRFGQQELYYGPHVISPSILSEKHPGEEFRACGFENEIHVDLLKPIRINDEVLGWVAMELLIMRKVTLTNLPSKREMGKKILENKVESDFQIIADDDSRFDCHKAFLASNSEALAGMLQMDCKESKEKAIKLKMTAKGVEALLKFIYYSDVNDPMRSCSIAMELLETGHQYDIVHILGLEEAMKDIFLGQRYDWFDINTAILLYLWTLKVDGNEDLKLKTLQAFKSKPEELEDSSEYDKLVKEFPHTAKGLMALCFKI